LRLPSSPRRAVKSSLAAHRDAAFNREEESLMAGYVKAHVEDVGRRTSSGSLAYRAVAYAFLAGFWSVTGYDNLKKDGWSLGTAEFVSFGFALFVLVFSVTQVRRLLRRADKKD
jgi:hypothetical protein